jgi:hypothetical protein
MMKMEGILAISVVPKALNTAGKLKIVLPLLTCRAAPRAILSIPNVTTKEWIFHLSVTNPLKRPQAMPTKILATTARKIAHGTGKPHK